jgi:hypothetical protein
MDIVIKPTKTKSNSEADEVEGLSSDRGVVTDSSNRLDPQSQCGTRGTNNINIRSELQPECYGEVSRTNQRGSQDQSTLMKVVTRIDRRSIGHGTIDRGSSLDHQVENLS